MKKARDYHAVVAVVDVRLFCYGIVGQTNKKQFSSPPSSPPMFTILSSLIPCHILYPISYCFHNYRLWALRCMQYCNIIRLLDEWNDMSRQTRIMTTLIIIIIVATSAILFTFTIYSTSWLQSWWLVLMDQVQRNLWRWNQDERKGSCSRARDRRSSLPSFGRKRTLQHCPMPRLYFIPMK